MHERVALIVVGLQHGFAKQIIVEATNGTTKRFSLFGREALEPG